MYPWGPNITLSPLGLTQKSRPGKRHTKKQEAEFKIKKKNKEKLSPLWKNQDKKLLEQTHKMHDEH